MVSEAGRRRSGPTVMRLIRELFADRVLDNLRAAQGVIGLSKNTAPAVWKPPANGRFFLTTPNTAP